MNNLLYLTKNKRNIKKIEDYIFEKELNIHFLNKNSYIASNDRIIISVYKKYIIVYNISDLRTVLKEIIWKD